MGVFMDPLAQPRRPRFQARERCSHHGADTLRILHALAAGHGQHREARALGRTIEEAQPRLAFDAARESGRHLFRAQRAATHRRGDEAPREVATDEQRSGA